MSEAISLNGDSYLGNIKGTIPHGKGKCTWSDGTIYDGDWEEGKMTGKGHTIWPSGANYEGDFSMGCLHGFGTFTSPDGFVYKGSWKFNSYDGVGRKQYCNSDIYDGSWKGGIREGIGEYAWSNGNLYIGNWKAGMMSGRGVMKWLNGDFFDGYWSKGFRHGYGVYSFANGSYYFGTWSRGLKDGQGTFYPVGSKRPSLKNCCSLDGYEEKRKGLLPQSSSLNSEEYKNVQPRIKHTLFEKISINGLFSFSDRISSRSIVMEADWIMGDSVREGSSCDTIDTFSCCTSEEGQCEVEENSDVIFEREYLQGVLIKEMIKNNVGRSNKGKQWRKFSAKAVKRQAGADIYESHKSYYLMLNLQLGIRYTVGKITPVPMRKVRYSDFGARARIRMYFPRKGSQFTPPHHSIDFYWKGYCPMVFRNLREMFKLDAAEYMMSICGDDGLRELSSPGKSGSIFYLSHDDRFVIKTLNRSELKVLLRMLPSYYNHVKEYENTLITKFFGLHQIALRGGKKVRFMVMGNMFCTELQIHRRYDLKGSCQGRFTNKDKIDESTTLKDLDLSYKFYMDKSLHESLFRQISLDCMFLESQQIIDYSLLLGLHFRAPENLKALLEPPDSLHKPEEMPSTDGGISQGDPPISPKGLILVTHEPSSVNTAPGPHIRGNTLRASSVGDKEVDLLLPGTGRLRVQLGVNMPAQSAHKLVQLDSGSAEVELCEVYEVVVYLGIIDILQDYNMKKKIEHVYKSFRFDPMSISAVEPKLYSKRFVTFLEKVFPAEP